MSQGRDDSGCTSAASGDFSALAMPSDDAGARGRLHRGPVCVCGGGGGWGRGCGPGLWFTGLVTVLLCLQGQGWNTASPVLNKLCP